MYQLAWLSTLLFAVNGARSYLSTKVDMQEWDVLYRTIKVSINAIFASWLLVVTRRSRSFEGQLGWTVGWVTIFLINWPSYADDIRQTLRSMTPHIIFFWGSLIAVLVWIASALTRVQLRVR
jgi:hypothetical protein